MLDRADIRNVGSTVQTGSSVYNVSTTAFIMMISALSDMQPAQLITAFRQTDAIVYAVQHASFVYNVKRIRKSLTIELRGVELGNGDVRVADCRRVNFTRFTQLVANGYKYLRASVYHRRRLKHAQSTQK